MKNFNVNATGLIIRFACSANQDLEELQISELPEPNFFLDTIRDSENSTEEVFESDTEGHSYKVVVYKNIAEGNVEVFDLTSDEEVTEFEIEECYE